jgi:hypothetical protein
MNRKVINKTDTQISRKQGKRENRDKEGEKERQNGGKE